MPQKRQAGGTTASPNDPGDNEKPKKRRVSLACDACRAAREKCDGARPRCGTCTALARPCSYTPATKKRGVQTGYLRTIELSLAWLFDQIPDSEQALFRLLAQPAPGRGEARALLGKGSTGHHLQKVWNETRVRKAIDALLADTQNAPSDSSDNEHVAARGEPLDSSHHDGRDSSHPRLASSLTTTTMQDSTGTSGSDRVFGTLLRLPPHWERLMAVYTSYTHCWLPIVHPEALRCLAASYGASGIHVDLDADRSGYSRHSELWAALAIAAFQDAPRPVDRYSSAPDPGELSELSELSASYILRVARSLLPGDGEVFDLHNTSAVILHSVILIGRGRLSSASLLLGRVARLLKGLRFRDNVDPCMRRHAHDMDRIQLDTAAMACSLLGTLTSLSMNQHVPTEIRDAASNIFPSTAEFTGFDQVWRPVPRSGPPRQFPAAAASPTMEPIRTLTQLHALAVVLHGLVYPKRHGGRQTRRIGPEALAQTLDPRFAYCNSFMSSSSTPILPSAFLVKLLFLTMTNERASQLRLPLLSGFLEAMESCFQHFGAARTPPVVSLLLQILQKRSRTSGLCAAEKESWCSAFHKLHRTWQDGPESNSDAGELLQQRPQQRQQKRQQEEEQEQDLPPKAMALDQLAAGAGQAFDLEAQAHPLSHPGSSPSGLFRQSMPTAADKDAVPPRFGYQQPAAPDSDYAAHVAMSVAANADADADAGPSRRDMAQLAFGGGHEMNTNFDYEALYGDLGPTAMGFTDDVEMDSRLMTNLGFVPGCDLADMFQGNGGV
ncbi:hypothetical protein E4U42_004667 [Claviceps africana]|uniref:Zn(2)-C6 fungal-type domain-containing protein n=1 Tax=Claviceps africana TaxID=83212 RepID=A0A8K0J4X9_9HYPO|nr:hypothetical protein E4U42_004667 [Claviceps africana]